MRELIFSAAVVLLTAISAAAQDATEKPDGVICRSPECDIRRTLAESFDNPLRLTELEERVRTMPVSALEPALPHIPFQVWLFRELEVYLPPGRSVESFAGWFVTHCADRLSAFPQAGPDLCVEFSSDTLENKALKIAVRVATAQISKSQTTWQEIVPVLHEILIEHRPPQGMLDTLGISSLRDIAEQLRLPVEKWPTVELRSAITWTPSTPGPGETVRFTFAVHNAGKRDARRVEVNLYVFTTIDSERHKEIRRSWFPAIPAGKTVTLDVSATLGRYYATASVDAHVVEPDINPREANKEDNSVVVDIMLEPRK